MISDNNNSHKWKKDIPYNQFPGHFLIKGSRDDRSFKVVVNFRCKTEPKFFSEEMAMESVFFGLSMLRIYEVEGIGDSEFQVRPLYEVRGVLWKELNVHGFNDFVCSCNLCFPPLENDHISNKGKKKESGKKYNCDT